MFINIKDNSGVGINITNIGFNPQLEDVNNIAAALSPYPGNYEDNRNALIMSELRLKSVFTNTNYNALGGKLNYNEFYRSIITDIGLDGSAAANAADTQGLLINQIENKRQSVMGVSLDEEMSNLIKFEHSYNAAVRTINAMDEMIEAVVNRVGLVGR